MFDQRWQQNRLDRAVNDVNLVSRRLKSDCGERFGRLSPQLLQNVISYDLADGRQPPGYFFTAVFHHFPVAQYPSGVPPAVAALAGGPATEQKRHIKSPAHRAGQLTLRGKPARSWPGLARLAQSLPTTSLMKAHNLTTRLKIWGGCALVIAAVWLCVRLAFFATSRALRKASETVTLRSNPQ